VTPFLVEYGLSAVEQRRSENRPFNQLKDDRSYVPYCQSLRRSSPIPNAAVRNIC